MERLSKDPFLRSLIASVVEEGWKDFLKEKYEGGKKKLPNTNPKTKAKYPQVSVNLLLKKDENFKAKVQEEFRNWKSEHDKKIDPWEKEVKEYASLINKYNKTSDTFIEDLLNSGSDSGKEYAPMIDDFVSLWWGASGEEEKSEILREYAHGFSYAFYDLLEKEFSEGSLHKYKRHIASWVISSNTKRSWQMHNFADRLGFVGDHYFGESAAKAKEENWGVELDPEMGKIFSLAYSYQQTLFKKLGIKNLTLYRGVQTSKDYDLKTKVTIDSRPCASTSNNRDMAVRFGNHLIKYKVPAKNVFISPFLAHYLSGSTSLQDSGESSDEDEYVVMGVTDLIGKVVERMDR